MTGYPARKTVRHGSASGAARHAAAGEPPCDACRAAKAEYDRRRKEAPEIAKRSRDHAKAQQRALRDLRHNHPAEYRVLYEAHKSLIAEEQQANVRT